MPYHGPRRRGRTYTKDQFDEAQALWAQGEFSAEWKEWRHLAAMEAGLLFPPIGSRWDSWADDEPSERALLIRAIRETPKLLRQILTTERVGSWSNVVALLIRQRDELAADVRREDAEAERQSRPDHRESAQALAGVMARIADSAGVAR